MKNIFVFALALIGAFARAESVELQITQTLCHSDAAPSTVSTLNHQHSTEADYGLSTLKCLVLEDKLDDASNGSCPGQFVMAQLEVDPQAHKITKIVSTEILQGKVCH